MNQHQLINEIKKKSSFLCVGLDTHLEKLPASIPKDFAGMLQFNTEIIEATKELAVAYKINTAFYEQYGSQGWELMAKTRALIPSNCMAIADAKRGDIGNTSTMYAHAFFKDMDFDAITLSPYMGRDSIEPFFKYQKNLIVLALTSNAGADDFQFITDQGLPLYAHVLRKVQEWIPQEHLMFVTGATRASVFSDIRKHAPDHFLLVPGVGKQGGSLAEVSRHGMNKNCGLLVNSSRGIIYADATSAFAQSAHEEGSKLQKEMSLQLRNNGILK